MLLILGGVAFAALGVWRGRIGPANLAGAVGTVVFAGWAWANTNSDSINKAVKQRERFNCFIFI